METTSASELHRPEILEDVSIIYRRHPLSASTTRVLHILPATSPDMSDTISCQLSVISIDPSPEYRALSYVWGDPSATKSILVDNTPFEVRENLWNYLAQARHEGYVDALWIDAICINQDDLDERSKQVAIMGQIYSKASELAYGWESVLQTIYRPCSIFCTLIGKPPSEDSGGFGDLPTNDSSQYASSWSWSIGQEYGLYRNIFWPVVSRFSAGQYPF